MGCVKYTRKDGGDVKNGLKCEMDDGSVPSMASKPPTNHLFSPRQNVSLTTEINKNLINLDTSRYKHGIKYKSEKKANK